MAREVLVATSNAGKLRELTALLPGIALRSLRDVECGPLDEPGEDYATNAVAKARAASLVTGRVTLADDSGLEVDALGGAPGWRSARFGGEPSDDARNRARLLDALLGVPRSRRGARFRCAVAIADARGPLGSRVLLAFGACTGRVTDAPRGALGFGYDPVLELEGTTYTMAEIDDATKNRVSHRARAVEAIVPTLAAYLAARR